MHIYALSYKTLQFGRENDYQISAYTVLGKWRVSANLRLIRTYVRNVLLIHDEILSSPTLSLSAIERICTELHGSAPVMQSPEAYDWLEMNIWLRWKLHLQLTYGTYWMGTESAACMWYAGHVRHFVAQKFKEEERKKERKKERKTDFIVDTAFQVEPLYTYTRT